MCVESYKGLIIFSLQECVLEVIEGGWDVLWQVDVWSGSCLTLTERGKPELSEADREGVDGNVTTCTGVSWMDPLLLSFVPCLCGLSPARYTVVQPGRQEVTLAAALLSAAGRPCFCVASCSFQQEERNSFLSGVKKYLCCVRMYCAFIQGVYHTF